MIKSFSNTFTEKIFFGEALSKKERKAAGDLNIAAAQEALKILDVSNEKQLMIYTALKYHKLHGTSRYSIDANGRKSKWRITFEWEDQDLQNVEFVKIEDTHK